MFYGASKGSTRRRSSKDMTAQRPRGKLPKGVRNALLRWGVLLTLLVAVWYFDQHSRGDVVVPWLLIVPAAALMVGLAWLFTRPLAPEVEQALEQEIMKMARESAVCSHCGRPRTQMATTCASCGRVVDWTRPITLCLVLVCLLLVAASRFVS